MPRLRSRSSDVLLTVVVAVLLLQTTGRAAVDCTEYLSEDDCRILEDLPGPMAWAEPLAPQFRNEVRQLPELDEVRRGAETPAGATVPSAYVSVLAPAAPGATLDPQPRFYWFLSHDVTSPIRIKLFRGFSGMHEVVLEDGARAGIHAFDLAEQGVTLEKSEVYELFVAIDNDTQVVSRGSLVLVDAPSAAPPPASAAERAEWFIENRLWYDALAALDQAIEKDSRWRALRAQLLEEVGLELAAAYDRRDLQRQAP